LRRCDASPGQGESFAAFKEFDRLLRIYPQFGEPEADLKQEGGQVYNGIVPPLVMRYAIVEDRRLVLVGALPVLLRYEAKKPDSPADS